ncbi:LuxR C-terminal-related transcriptional regulator [Winogradskyella sp. A3E31]|uniref:helix-turn-helix and ligand-binding sensor domain-containing protein n=1 Tax=Winogradskyella sp. A3E31 TaxID=3349637 RepID=UPI00398B85D9
MNKLLLIFLFISSGHCFAQFSPGIKNYDLGEYRAANQNWDVTRAENGKVYVANNNGLLEYDAKGWRFYQLPNKTTLRSVLALGNRVYTGSYEEFGYWQKNEKGLLKYSSLSESIKNQISSNEEIWEIVEFGDKVVFRSFSNIYIYDGNSIEQHNPKSSIISCNVVKGKLYICTLNKGIFLLDETGLKEFFFSQELVDTKMISLSSHNDKLLLMTSLKGSFFIENNRLTPTNFQINNLIEENQLNDFSLLKSGDMALGTIKDGVYIINIKGKLKYHVNKESGLINNTVLGQHIDTEGKLWLGLDHGIASVDIDSPNYFYNDVSGRLGAVYDVITFKNTLYIGSNTGLFMLNSQKKLDFIEGSQGQVWELKIIEDQLFCGHNEGTFVVEGNQIKKISDFTGGWTIKKVPGLEKTYIQGTYSGLVKFEKENNAWSVKHMGKTTIPSRFLVFEDTYSAWVAHAYKGLYKVNFDKNYESITSIENYDSKGINSLYNIRVYNLKNETVFKTNTGWRKYQPILDSIVSYDLLNDLIGKDRYIISEPNLSPIALKGSSNITSLKNLTEPYNERVLDNSLIKNRYIIGYERISKISDSTHVLNLDNGFMLIDTNYKTTNKPISPTIETISVGDDFISPSLSNDELIEIKHNQGLILELSSPKSNNHFFQYSIPTLSDEWFTVEHRTLDISNFKSGEYDIKLRTKYYSGDTSSIKTLSINVLPPWYKGTVGYILYAFLLLLAVLLFYYMHHKKIIKEQRLIKIKLRKEQQKLLREKTLENEKRIVQLKNESLQNEINIKSKQLANTAMALVKKNETLQDIKRALATNKNGFSNVYYYKKLIKRVDHSIEHNDEWEVFEENFNQVHKAFFERLNNKHQKLNSRDLKICAYIKMNLSTKEIAPLMNISIRGVETHRYRLKKKLNLEDDISLTDYLLNID